MRLKPTKNTIIILGALLGLVVVAMAGILWLQGSMLDETQQKLAARETELKDGQLVARRREDARTALEADRAQLKFLETAVSDSAYVPTLLKQLEDLATSTKNQVLGVRPQLVAEAPTKLQQRRDPDAQAKEGEPAGDGKEEKKKPEPYTRLIIQVNLVGRFDSTQAFVDRLTRFPKIVAVNELQLRPHRAAGGKPEDSDGLLDVEIRLTAFVMKEGAAALPAVTASADVGGTN